MNTRCSFSSVDPVWNLYMSTCLVYRDRKTYFSSYTGRTVPLVLIVLLHSSSVGKQLDAELLFNDSSYYLEEFQGPISGSNS